MAVTKADFTASLCEKIGLNQREANELVNLFFEALKDTLARSEAVKLSGFGNFSLRDKRPRRGRNPKTGEDALVTALRVVTFKAGNLPKERVDNHLTGQPLSDSACDVLIND
ncbi:MAG: integration host factor subunit alpha [Methylobacter sp.]|nr:integration host factor subunit alpha [Dehalococcoidia bacterium]MDD5581487.1 integration host factor subunit alpha [Methylobacter sp.]